MTRRAVAVALVCLTAVGAATTYAVVDNGDFPVSGRAISGGPACTVGGVGAFTTPDETCTPGAQHGSLRHFIPGPELGVCEHRPRVNVSILRRQIIRDYGMDPANFRGELDHRVPHFLGGTDNKANLWPEIGPLPNRKDRLETWVNTQVCTRDRGRYVRPGPMSPKDAVQMFLGDWVGEYCEHVPGAGRDDVCRR